MAQVLQIARMEFYYGIASLIFLEQLFQVNLPTQLSQMARSGWSYQLWLALQKNNNNKIKKN